MQNAACLTGRGIWGQTQSALNDQRGLSLGTGPCHPISGNGNRAGLADCKVGGRGRNLVACDFPLCRRVKLFLAGFVLLIAIARGGVQPIRSVGVDGWSRSAYESNVFPLIETVCKMSFHVSTASMARSAASALDALSRKGSTTSAPAKGRWAFRRASW